MPIIEPTSAKEHYQRHKKSDSPIEINYYSAYYRCTFTGENLSEERLFPRPLSKDFVDFLSHGGKAPMA